MVRSGLKIEDLLLLGCWPRVDKGNLRHVPDVLLLLLRKISKSKCQDIAFLLHHEARPIAFVDSILFGEDNLTNLNAVPASR